MAAPKVVIPAGVTDATVQAGDRDVRLTNLPKVFFPETGLTKGGLLQYYADVAGVLLPHVLDRPMVMKRYPNGQTGAFFFMKRTPSGAPEWLRRCLLTDNDHPIVAPVIDDLAALLWVINLGCIDLNQWYARCDETNRPDYLHFDLDPVKGGGTPFSAVLEVALQVRAGLAEFGFPCYAKTSGSAGVHLYVPIVRGPEQHDVWRLAKGIATGLAARHPATITAEYKVARRPQGRVLIDYNQNAWGRTLASVYSVRPTARATVSMPVTWDEIERGISIEDFRVDNARERIAKVGDLWKPLLSKTKRVDLSTFL
jgi:bifunctional non-homologous end joining protein LigD